MAGSSKQFVYLPTVCKHTWLLWSKRANTVKLRMYKVDRVQIVKTLGLLEAEALLALSNSRVEAKACFNTIRSEKLNFWFQLSNSLNIRDGLIPADEKDRLQSVFKLQCLRPLLEGKIAELKAIFEIWREGFRKVKDKEVKINDYDHKDTANLFPSDWGKAWQSQLLENSRSSNMVSFIETGDPATDFSCAAMELTLAISSKNNPFFPKSSSRIAPDGLGVRRNGFLTVLEVKGPSDEKDLLNPLLQATCGALAVVAKKDMLCRALQSNHGRRIKYAKAIVPKGRSIGLHILTAKKKKKRTLESWSENHENICRRVLKAFPQLQYIAYSFVIESETNNFRKIKVDRLVTL